LENGTGISTVKDVLINHELAKVLLETCTTENMISDRLVNKDFNDEKYNPTWAKMNNRSTGPRTRSHQAAY
jgi:hypothetical protein